MIGDEEWCVYVFFQYFVRHQKETKMKGEVSQLNKIQGNKGGLYSSYSGVTGRDYGRD